MGLGSSRRLQTRPPDRAQIGHAAWRYLHTMATHYPEQPAPFEREDALRWLRSFVELYPCGLCAQEFIEVTKDLPPQLGSREEYTMWWCKAHNRVRDDLSQPIRECDPAALLAAGRAGLSLDELGGCQDKPVPAGLGKKIQQAHEAAGKPACAACS